MFYFEIQFYLLKYKGDYLDDKKWWFWIFYNQKVKITPINALKVMDAYFKW